MEDCVFCKIATGEIPCEKIWEDESFIAGLDINPVSEGMTLVIPKHHYDSRVFKNSDQLIKEIVVASKKVAEMIEKSLNIERVGLIFEGKEINHLHAKLIPLRQNENIKTVLNSGYPKPTQDQLHNLALRITGKN